MRKERNQALADKATLVEALKEITNTFVEMQYVHAVAKQALQKVVVTS